ncbi:endonuclease/exonuclease/phosphatase family protein [Agrobacterium sp. ES01]|uniref:endonuclease/exonuclease/phosphatase family protein n=1 Tax=Agrobacterium sp. ES01 TaxID=3420714 RepID=UPI003D0A372B
MKKNGNLAQAVFHSLRTQRRPPIVVPSVRKTEDCLVVASYNVHKCVGTDGRFDAGRVIDVISQIGADVIALQEADMRHGERAGLLDLNRLRHETGLVPVAVPVRPTPKSHGWCGNVLLFRQGMARDVHQVSLPGLEPRGALMADIELERGATIRIIAAHLGLLRRSRRKQAGILLDMLDTGNAQPTLLMGDFNEWRLGNGSALKQLERVLGPLPPALPSFPARLPVLSLDRIIGNREGLVDHIAVHDTPLARLASDHLPLVARIDIEAGQEA